MLVSGKVYNTMNIMSTFKKFGSLQPNTPEIYIIVVFLEDRFLSVQPIPKDPWGRTNGIFTDPVIGAVFC